MQSAARTHALRLTALACLLAGVATLSPALFPAYATDLGSGQLQIAGTRLTVSPEAQTVPFNTPTIVETQLQGFDPASGTLPTDLRVVADFTGPEIDGVLRLETLPNEPFRIPRLSLKGQYRLDDIRLVQGEELLAYAEPRSAGVLVTQVLVTRVTSRPLTLDEIRSYGIVIDDDRFHAFNFTFGFAVDGQTFDYNVPIITGPGGELPENGTGAGSGSVVQFLDQGSGLGGSTGTSGFRFRPPRMAPFTLELDTPSRADPQSGGCQAIHGCELGAPVSLPGVILFPTDVSLLNQFFSVVVVAKNDAPAGDPLTIRDLTARVSLPPGLRLAETEPPTLLGVPVPVQVPGADGRLGTADDLTFLVAQAEGQAEVLVEGRKRGTHLVEFELQGVLDGFPDGEIRRVTGKARGAVVVRDPTLGLTITHPEVVRTDEEYSLLLTVSNTGNAPVNLVEISLPVAELSGAQVVGESSKTIPTLPPGESEVVEFRLLPQRTGRVVASSIRHGSQVDPRFELSVGVGELGVPLSPDTILLPDSTETLPPDLLRNALALVGLGYSLATAPTASMAPEHPQISLSGLHERVYPLGQAGRHVRLGEDPFDSLAVLAAEWTGARNPDWEWDDLRRRTDKGGRVGDSFAQAFASEATATSPEAAFDRFAATTAFLGPLQAALADGSGATLTVTSRTSGKTLAGSGIDPLRLRGLPFADLYDLGGAQMALLANPETGGYRVRLEDGDGGTSDLHLLVPDGTGALRMLRWSAITLSAAGSAEVEYHPSDTAFTLEVDSDGDGFAEASLAPVEDLVTPRAFTAVAAVQDETTVSGHTIEVLFTQDLDLSSLLPRDPDRFTLPDNVSNGGLVQSEHDVGSLFELIAENPFEGLMNTRVVQVVFSNPVSPYKTHDLTVRDLASVTGQTLTNSVVPVQTTVTDPGTVVQGTVYGPDGQPVPFARVELFEVDLYYFSALNDPCRKHRTALVEADASGRFELDYVRHTQCSDLFEIRGTDPASGHHGTARGRVRFIGQTVALDVLMLGRGTVRGRVTYDDGSIPEDLQVVGYSPVFFEGKEATYGPEGTYEIRDLPVGTISLGASDRQGSFVYQTVELPRAGAVVERDLTILRRPADEPTGDVRGTVVETDGTTPVFDAYVALYVDGELAGVERSGLDGGFDFGTVPAGLAEIEAYDGLTGLSGAQIFFDVEPDQVNDVTVLLRDDRGTVEGHVYRQTLSEVTPVEGAVVWVSGTPFNTVTDETGYYRLEGVFAGNRTILAADLEAGVQTSASVTISSGGETVFRDLYFIEAVGGGLAGEVVGFTGNPVGGATIHLADGHGGWWKETFTDTQGRFVLPDLPPGTYEIHAIQGTAGAVRRATIRFEGETPFVRLQFERGSIQGSTRTINESGQTVGVTSLVTYRTTVVLDTGLVALDYEAHTLETAADGTFEIPNVLTGRYQLTVTNAFHGEKTVRDELVFAGEVAQHDFLFEPNGRIGGVVLDWDGETPVPGATVHLRHPSFSEYDLQTDEEGRFLFDLVPPRSRRFPIDAEVERDGVFRTARVWVGFHKNGQELDVEIVLPMQGSVSGWVEDANGAPVPGAVVTLREDAYPHRKLVHNADSEGNFSFTNVFAGPVSLSAQAPSLGGLGGRDSVEIVEEGQEVYSVVVLEATGEITGRIFSPETGEIVPTAQVTLDRWNWSRFDSVTASEGEYRFRLLPLSLYRVRVFDPSTGRFGRSDWVPVDFNGHVVPVDVTLEARGDVDGHLYEPESGLGVPGATIRLQTRSLRPFTTYSSTDVDGYFELLGIPEGSFTLSTKEPEGRRLASGSGEIVEEDQRVSVDLYLEAVGRVVGSVFTPAGQPDGLFANANVLIYESGQVVGATLDNPFAFEGVLANRSLELRAYENGGDHRARVKGRLQEGESEITLDLRMVPLGSAAVTVLDSAAIPLGGADVTLRNHGFYGSKHLTASTGGDGRADFQGLGEGSISVSASHPTVVLKGSAHGQLTLDGEQVEIVVQLEDSGAITGRILTSDGVTPAADALVVVTRGSRTLQTLADGNGDFTFQSVPLGSFTLFVQESFGPGTMERQGTVATNGELVSVGALVLDDHDPAVVTMAPASGSADLPLSTAVTVRFTEPLDPARWSGSWITFRKVGSSGVSYTPTWSEGDTVLTLTPSSPLASFTAYEVIVQSAYDLAGRKLQQRTRTTFNTVDVVPPTVVDVLPRDGQNQVPVDASILVTFSEPVAFASLSGSSFQLTDLTTGSGVATTFEHLAGERQVLVTPASGLQTDHHYQLTVQGVSDNGGNAMTTPVTTTFWTLDTIPPQIVSVDFPAGSGFVSGDDVPVVVTATDERGVASVRVAITEWSWTDTTDPYELTGLAPVVTEATEVTVNVEVTDLFGNLSSAAPTIQVSPRTNPTSPTTTVECVRELGFVVPGVASEIRLASSDDEAVESLRLSVDGVEIERVTPVNLPETEHTFLWTPSESAPAGASFELRLESRDFAGNVASHEVTVQVPQGTILRGGGSVFDDYAGQDLTLAEGVFTAREALHPTTLRIARGATLAAVGLPESDGVLEIVVDRLELACNAAIDVTGLGYPGGTAPAWVSSSGGDAGGSHGGAGRSGTPGETFDSVYRPALPGAGGAGTGGGPGGGTVILDASTLILDGDVLARGQGNVTEPNADSAGAGGTVSLGADSLEGAGSIDASGGDQNSCSIAFGEGSGGGGRIAIEVTSLIDFDPVTQARAWGGTQLNCGTPGAYAGAGTVLVKRLGDSYGRLRIDNGTTSDGTVRDGPAAKLPPLGTGAVVGFTPSSADVWVEAAAPFLPRWLGASMVLLDGSGQELGRFPVVELGPTGDVRLAGAGAVSGAASYRGEYRFDQLHLVGGSKLDADDPVFGSDLLFDGQVEVAGELLADTLRLTAGSRMIPAAGGSFQLDIAGTVTVEAGAEIDVSGRGFAGGTAPSGVSASGGGAGGSHGGTGRSGQPGAVYDSVYRPSLAGGGGAGTDGGPGGGVLTIEATELVLEGALLARGVGNVPVGNDDSAGAGGTVRLQVGTLRGSGSIDASGGEQNRCGLATGRGSGGGGRVTLDVGALEGFDPALQARAWGGTQYQCDSPDGYAGAGTVLVKLPGDSHGRLRIDNGTEADGTPRTGPATELPPLGADTVIVFDTAGSDAWITASTPLAPRWEGVWMALADGGGAELGNFRVVEIDPAGRALLAGAAGASAAATLQGEYRFDEILVGAGASIKTTDPVESGDLVYDGEVEVEGEVVAESLLVRPGGVVRPAPGQTLGFRIAGELRVEAGARIDVSGEGYAAGEAPSWVSTPEVANAAGSHGGAGTYSGIPGEERVYDSVYLPQLPGGGGAADGSGQPGGGVLEIDAGTLVLEGEILARGGSFPENDSPGGAGGSIVVRVGSVTGSGRIDASGGDGLGGCAALFAGAGGGGRVALEVGLLTGFDPVAQVWARGGSLLGCADDPVGYAPPGTVLLKGSGSVYGDLIVNNGTEADGASRTQGRLTHLPPLGAGSAVSFEGDDTDAWITASAPFRPRWHGAWMTLVDATGAELGTFEVVELDPTGRARLAGGGAVSGAATYRGEYRFDSVEVRHATLSSTDPVVKQELVLAGEVEVVGEAVEESVLVRAGAVVRPDFGDTLRFQVAGPMIIEAGARIDVSGKGYGAATAPQGVTPADGSNAGGSHGGAGRYSGVPVLDRIYDSVYEPWMAGAGGAGSDGRPGGGIVDLAVGDLVLDGEILALGLSSDGNDHSAGAGGTVRIRASSISGAGRIDASGGSGLRCSFVAAGAAGGGRIALYADSLDAFDVASKTVARGGGLLDCSDYPAEGYASAGTVFVKTLLSTHGDLRIDQEAIPGLLVPATLLPAIGKGTVGTTAPDAADPADLWIQDQDPARLYSLGVVGMWVRIGGVDYPVLAQSADRRQVLLDGAAGAVATGNAYVGMYKFDSVTVAGDAHLELLDGDEVGTWNVAPGSSVTRLDLEPPTVTVTSPAAGTLFTAGDTVPIAADVTDPSGVASVTFALGDQSFVDDTSPYEWSVAAPVVEVEQDVEITLDAVDSEGNLGTTTHTIRVRPVAPGDPPVVTLGCPSPGARLAPGTGLDFDVTATHDEGVERVELLVGDETTPVATDFDAPYDFRYDVPVDAVEGDVVTLHFRARSVGGVYGETSYSVDVIAANVISGDTFLAGTDTSLDGSSMVVAAGTLTVEGPHTFRDLVVLSGAGVTHPASTADTTESLALDLTRDLFVACGGTVDAAAKGYPGAVSYHPPGTDAFYLTDDFNDGDISDWQIVDEGEEGGPSNWSVSGGSLRQTTNIVSQIHKGFGTSLVWPGPLGVDDYRFSTFLRSNDNDTIGLLFRYVDPGNVYRFLWHRQGGYRLLEKVVNGQRMTLAEDGVPYSSNTWYLVEVVTEGPRLELWIDGQKIFSVSDAAHPSGSVGVFCVANAGSYFDDILVTPIGSSSSYAGGSHGGRGGSADGSNRVYGNLFDPADPGAGGGGLMASPGGGVVRIAAAGDAVVDGTVTARGSTSVSLRPSSAGGSIRLDGASITGLGTVDASGGDGLALPAAGGGGRIALYGATIAEGLLTRTLAAGGDADTPERRGAAGTIFVKRDSQALGDLILDNAGLDTAQPTELLAVLPGVVDAVGTASLTDDQADFPHDLTGVEVFLNGDTSTLWPVTGHEHHGQTLDLDTSVQALTAVAGDDYEGLYRFDRVIVRGGAEAVTRSKVQSLSPPEVEAGSSWSADYQPTVTLTSPAPGQGFVGGGTVTVTASVDDVFGIPGVLLELGDQGVTDSTAPYTATFTAPPVTASTEVQVAAVARDASGYEIRDAITVTVDPNPDPVAPVVSLADCPRSGDQVLPGVPLDLGFTVTDNQLLESYRVLVDGAVVEEGSAVDQSSVSTSFSWTPPAGALPGTVFTVRVEGRDYAGRIGSGEWQLVTPPGTVLTGSQALDATHEGLDLSLASGSFTVVEPLGLQSLTLLPGAVLTGSAGADLDLGVTNQLRVQCGGKIDVSSQGYLGGHSGHPGGYAPDWVAPSSPDAGGSHGGSGISFDTPGTAGEVYGSVYYPHLAGGGGALRNGSDTGYRSGTGGGVVEIVAGSVVLDGEILALGEGRWSYRSGGAGGSVLLDVAGSVSGTGRIDASGGDSGASSSSGREGSGGGGRVALYTGSIVGFDPLAQVSVQGGRQYYGSTTYGYGAPGTALVFTDGVSTYGDLIVDSGAETDGTERKGPVTELPSLGSGSVVLFETAGADGWVTGSSAFPARWLGARMALEDASGTELGVFPVVEVDPAGRALLAGVGGVVSPSGYRGEYRFDGVTLRNGAGLASSDRLQAGSVRAEGTSRLPSRTEVLGDVTVVSGAMISAAEGEAVRLEVGGTLTVEAGASLDVSSQGYLGGHSGHPDGYAPAWVAPSSPDAGGSHGGPGRSFDTSGTAGEVYGSVYYPHLAGGGGALRNTTDTSYRSGTGGGVVEIVAGSVVLDGEILALGEGRWSYRSGGAGGSVLLDVAGSVSGTGRIDASGGDSGAGSSSGREGSGGGGRVALYADSFVGFDPLAQVSVQGGRQYYGSTTYGYGAPGTALVFTDGVSTYGDLIVDSGAETDGTERKGPVTELPSLGSGSVVSFETAGADGRVTGSSAFPARWLGARMALEDASGTELGVFSVVEVDPAGRALLAGAGGVASPSGYQGEYRFDGVTLRNGAGLVSSDRLQAGSVRAEGTSRLPSRAEVLGDVTVVSGAMISAAEGDAVRLEVGGTLTVEAGAVLDLTGKGYSGSDASQPEGYAPAGVQAPGMEYGGSHGGLGDWWHPPPAGSLAGEVYDSVYSPLLPGGGGARDSDGYSEGLAGGGVLEVVAGTVVVDGEIRADGLSGDDLDRAGGAGGTVWIDAGSLSGTGRISADGGYVRACSNSRGVGTGGGGRIALRVDDLTGFDVASQARAWGGAFYSCSWGIYRYSAAGTIYVKSLSSTYGELIVDVGEETGGVDRDDAPATELPALGSGSVVGLEASGGDAWLTGAVTLQPRWIGAWVALADASGAELGAYEVVDLDDTGRALLSGAGGVATPTSYEGLYRFDRIELRNGADLKATDRLEASSAWTEGAAGLPASVVVSGDVTVSAGSTASLTEGSLLHLEVGGILTVEAGAALDVSGQGYPGSDTSQAEGYGPPGVQAPGMEYGGSHGGLGDWWHPPPAGSLAGELYDSVYSPLLPGGGGARDSDGYSEGLAGGGVLEVVAGTVVVDGEIRADGLSGDDLDRAAGAGGTVWIDAGSLSGTGRISADGGYVRACSNSRGVGTGGGGRIALRVDDLTGFDLASQVQARGGTFYACDWGVYRCSAPGTIFLRTLTSTHGELFVAYTPECAGTAIVNTTLPTIGSGAVGVADPDSADPTDLWIEPQDPAALFDLGVTGLRVRIGGTDYPVLDQSADRRRLLLDGAAGLVSVGETYQGVYTFDTVTVRGGAVLEFLDTADVGTFDVDADSQVITPQ